LKRKLLLTLCLFSAVLYGQENKSITLGRASIEELKMEVYDKDSVANAVVLEENGFTFFNPKKEKKFTQNYYTRIKILNRSGFDKSVINIPVSIEGKIEDIEAITYNLSGSLTLNKTLLEKKSIYRTKLDENYNLISFAMPNVKIGSVIEYKYTYSRNGYGIYDWEFQTDIPKVKSVLKAFLPVNPKLNLRLIGYLRPSYEYSGFKANCVGDYYCTEVNYEMENIPAFVSEEYMTSINNYISRISFEKEYYNPFKYYKSLVPNRKVNKWGNIDKAFKKAYKFELNQKREYKKLLPITLLKEKNKLTRAKKIYNFIQNHFALNDISNLRLEEVFSEKEGTSRQINLALFNALRAGGLKVEIVLLSTRDNGFVTRLHPSIENFNYLVIKLRYKGKEYLLDASDKNLPFGLLQFQSLNGEGRALDFRYGKSYWQPIVSEIKSYKKTKVFLILKDNLISGKISVRRNGYDAKFMRDILELTTEDDIVSGYEKANLDLNIVDYKNTNLNDLEIPLKEEFGVSIDIEDEKRLKINPFLIERMKQNPFKLKKRKYPVDYGFIRSERFAFSIDISNMYKVKRLPESKAIILPGNAGSVVYSVMRNKNIITILYKFKLTKKIFTAAEYNSLKEFYNQIIKIQNTFIELEKI
jgi:hypothetical protein